MNKYLEIVIIVAFLGIVLASLKIVLGLEMILLD